MAKMLAKKNVQRIGEKSHQNRLDKGVFGEKLGLIATLFGCWHKRLSRPFSVGGSGYRACLDCGARKPFDSKTLETGKTFYYPPNLNDLVAE